MRDPSRPIRRAFLASVAVVLAFAGMVPASAAIARGRFGVGDSIMLSASDELADLGYHTNAEVGRQFSVGVRVVRRLAAHGKLPRNLVVHLGTNGPVDPDECRALVHLAPRRQIFLVNVRVPRAWEKDVNATLRACARPFDRVSYVNWWKKSRGHRRWLAEDGYHLTADGQDAYAAWIDDRVDAVVGAS